MEFEDLIKLGNVCYPYNSRNEREEDNILLFHLAVFNSMNQSLKEKCNELNLTNNEVFAYLMLIGNASENIQYPLIYPSYKPDNFISQIIKELDSFLLKIPKTKAKTLYRQDNYLNPDSFYEGQVITFNTFLNTSIDNFKNSHNIIWIINVNKLTKGHNVFYVDNSNNEKQVTFERGTSVLINKIKLVNSIFHLYCSEC